MVIDKNYYLVRCDMPGCVNYAEYAIKQSENCLMGSLNICSDCVEKLKNYYSSLLTNKKKKNIKRKNNGK